MSAANLFRNWEDAHFRLLNTYLYIGKSVWKVVEVGPHRENFASLTLNGSKTLVEGVPLARLPESAMTAAPIGYADGNWFVRGPARHRYQGLTAQSMWRVYADGSSENAFIDDVYGFLDRLAKQPIRKIPGSRNKIITNRVYRSNDGLLVDGINVGDLCKPSVLAPNRPLTHSELAALRLAMISIEDPFNG